MYRLKKFFNLSQSPDPLTSLKLGSKEHVFLGTESEFFIVQLELQYIMPLMKPIHKGFIKKIYKHNAPLLIWYMYYIFFAFAGDFFLLLFVCLQWQVFRNEAHSQLNPSTPYGGGSNEDILPEVEAKTPIPVEDFTTIHE